MELAAKVAVAAGASTVFTWQQPNPRWRRSDFGKLNGCTVEKWKEDLQYSLKPFLETMWKTGIRNYRCPLLTFHQVMYKMEQQCTLQAVCFLFK